MTEISTGMPYLLNKDEMATGNSQPP